MELYQLNQRCSVNTNYESDTFVGIKCENGDFSVHFPLGFQYSKDEKVLRREILLLINSIASTIGHKQSELKNMSGAYNQTEFPIQAYMAIIHDYYARGYYKERETQYQISKKGKINWNRTIKTQKPYVQGNKAFYLDFVTSKNQTNENEIITMIHEWCVYDAFEKIGWLFTKDLPMKPRIKFNKKHFIVAINEKLAHTFNDKNRSLFQNMLAIIEKQGTDDDLNYKYGTYRFEYVWESLIDKVFGIANKDEYFPKTTWVRPGKKPYDNASLEPDTIMIYDNDVYVLDAKYYKFGATGRTGDMPESTSINKQITYGEYIAETDDFKKKHGTDMKVYNAFIMPFSATSDMWKSDDDFLYVGEAISSWKTNKNIYERVQGILLDVKHLMSISVRQDESEIMKMAKCIEDAIMEDK